MHKRVTLTKKEKTQKLNDQEWKCAVCKGDLVEGNIDFDHLTEIWERPEKPYTKEEEYEGQKAICNDPCHKVKTRKAAARRAHHNRLEKARHALENGVDKPKRGKGKSQWGIPGLKKQINGKVVKR